ncbi:ribonuclease P protein component [Nakamurella leprariae]|uniref:Ribonuclease P protein component n=1 Tax=Nakamurella leprariae TaxID=2803911 RepID=A0A938YIJ7_9ACTN|nr:ribonuclease P protein component [Nakamurella leprariae]MBM9468967.1 ribonuclease P protein component [Nakamurella leprariae]
MLPVVHRLRRSNEFTAVFRSGRRGGTRTMVIHLLPSTRLGPPRAGFVVSGKIGNSVVRHRITRRLRPLVWQRLPLLPDGTDLVVRALAPASTASSPELEADLDAGVGVAARRAGIRLGAPAAETPGVPS